MAVVRTPLLPVGRYWAIIQGDENNRVFEQWVNLFSATLHWVRVETTTRVSESPLHEFVIFNVIPQAGGLPGASTSPPVTWDATRFGFANTAPPNIKGPQDVITNAPAPGGELGDFFANLFSGTGGLLVLAGLAYYFGSKK